jgi:hypothetical protein
LSRTAIHRWIAVLSLPVVLSGCYSWRNERGPMPQAAIDATSKGNPVRVRVRSGDRIYFDHANVAGDSIIGMSRGTPPKTGLLKTICKWCAVAAQAAYEVRPPFRRSVPMSDVLAIDQYRASVGEFFLALFLVVAITVGIFLLIGSSLQ